MSYMGEDKTGELQKNNEQREKIEKTDLSLLLNAFWRHSLAQDLRNLRNLFHQKEIRQEWLVNRVLEYGCGGHDYVGKQIEFFLKKDFINTGLLERTGEDGVFRFSNDPDRVDQELNGLCVFPADLLGKIPFSQALTEALKEVHFPNELGKLPIVQLWLEKLISDGYLIKGEAPERYDYGSDGIGPIIDMQTALEWTHNYDRQDFSERPEPTPCAKPFLRAIEFLFSESGDQDLTKAEEYYDATWINDGGDLHPQPDGRMAHYYRFAAIMAIFKGEETRVLGNLTKAQELFKSEPRMTILNRLGELALTNKLIEWVKQHKTSFVDYTDDQKLWDILKELRELYKEIL